MTSHQTPQSTLRGSTTPSPLRVDFSYSTDGSQAPAAETRSEQQGEIGDENMETKNLPVKKFRAGAISATVWNNQTKDGADYQTVTFERGYKDKEGVWKATSSLRMGDLPRAALVLQKAYEFLALGEQSEA